MDNIELNQTSNIFTISKKRLLLDIWTQPRKTIRYIIETNPAQFVLVLAMLSGIFVLLDKAVDKNLGENESLAYIYFGSIFGGSIRGILLLYIIGALLKWTGNWIGGKANYQEVLAAFAWGLVPMITIRLIMVIPELIFFGKDLYTSEMPVITSSLFLWTLLIIITVIEVVSIIWTIVVSLKCLGEVQGFSAWKALGNYLFAGLIVLIPIFLIAMIIN